MAEITRFEIHVHAVDDHGSASNFLHWAIAGPRNPSEADATKEFDRVVAAMRGADVGIFADHHRSVELCNDGQVLRRAAYGHDGEIVETVSAR